MLKAVGLSFFCGENRCASHAGSAYDYEPNFPFSSPSPSDFGMGLRARSIEEGFGFYMSTRPNTLRNPINPVRPTHPLDPEP